MTGVRGQLATLALSALREAVRLTPGVISFLFHHSAASLAIGLVVLVIVLIVRYAALLLVAALAIALLFSSATSHQATVQSGLTGSTSHNAQVIGHKAPGGRSVTAVRR